MKEIWAPIRDWQYEVSNLGNIRNTKRGNALVPYGNGSGYPKVSLYHQGKRLRMYVHRLVAEAFIPRKHGATEVNHIGGDPSNATSSNLEWVTSAENKQHARDFLGSFMGIPPRGVVVINKTTLETVTFPSTQEASRSLSITRENLIAVLKGRRKTVSGYTAFYKD